MISKGEDGTITYFDPNFEYNYVSDYQASIKNCQFQQGEQMSAELLKISLEKIVGEGGYMGGIFFKLGFMSFEETQTEKMK